MHVTSKWSSTHPISVGFSDLKSSIVSMSSVSISFTITSSLTFLLDNNSRKSALITAALYQCDWLCLRGYD